METRTQVPLASAQLEEKDAPVYVEGRQGFLPIETNWFDRLFISVVLWVALCLFWFRFIEPLGLSIWIANAIGVALAVILIRKG
jgi:predicted small integral membrane protein